VGSWGESARATREYIGVNDEQKIAVLHGIHNILEHLTLQHAFQHQASRTRVKGGARMTPKSKPLFDPKIFLAKVGQGRTIAEYSKDQMVFSQSDPANAVFYIQKGKVKLTVVSNASKEAIIAILDSGDFLGEGCLRAQPLRMATATAISNCSIVRLEKAAMVRVLHDEPAFSEMFVSHLLARTIRVEEDLVDQLFNSSEKRLARALLLLANFGKDARREPVIASQKSDQNSARATVRRDFL
jgi:CRP-like cAMP-binding protein